MHIKTIVIGCIKNVDMLFNKNNLILNFCNSLKNFLPKSITAFSIPVCETGKENEFFGKSVE